MESIGNTSRYKKLRGVFNLKFECCVCNEYEEKGIVLMHKFICRSCELSIVDTPQDQLKYEFYKKRIKDIVGNITY